MDIIVLPVTKSSERIRDNFLKQLSLRVDIEDNPIKKNIKVLIFKPTGRPKEEFDHMIEVFKETGGRLDDVIIFVTATKPDRVKFEVPEKYNFAHQTCVFLNDENEIDPKSSDAMKEIADFLIHSCGFQPYSHETSLLDVVSRTTEPKSKDSRKRGGKIPTYDDLKRKLEEQEREIHELQQENKRLKTFVEEKLEEKNDPNRGNKRLERTVEEKQDEKNIPQKESKRLKRTESRGDCLSPVIRIKVKRARVRFLGWCFGYTKVIYDPSLNAVEAEITNITEGLYDFQRKYEKKFHLKPGTLLKVLEVIRDELKNLPSDVLIVEGQNFENVKTQVDEKFGLPEDSLKSLLQCISKRHEKGKMLATPTSEETIPLCTHAEV